MKRSCLITGFLSFIFPVVSYLFPGSYNAKADPGSKISYLDSCKSGFASDAADGEPLYVFLQHRFDVRKYIINLKPNLDTGLIRATVTIEAISKKRNLDTIKFNFVGDWTIKKVLLSGKPAQWEHDGKVLSVKTGKSLAKDDGFDVTVKYKGVPSDDHDYYHTTKVPTFRVIDGQYARTHFEPFQARYFFPCFDEPSDKAEEGCEVIVTVPKDLTAVSNGLLVSTKEKGKNKIFRYSHKYPIATYLIGITIGQYVTIEDELNGLPLIHHVFPEYKEKAVRDFERFPEMIEYFSGLFGPYPFEKIGFVLVERGPSMEQQTIIYWVKKAIRGDKEWEDGMAHELAHHWWGNAVTVSDFRDIWIKEGFATYCEALWYQYLYGDKNYDGRGFKDNVKGIRSFYFWMRNRDLESGNPEPPPVYCPDYQSSTLYRWYITYGKAALIYHMLRWELGDDVFFEAMKKFISEHLHGYVTTADLRETLESVSSKDLCDYFQSWVYSPGHPVFRISNTYKTVDGQLRAVITVEQVQEFDTVFPMTLLIDPDGKGKTPAQRRYISSRSTKFKMDVREHKKQRPAEIVDVPGLLMKVVSGN